ncbi:LOW QUALITY PROTEIN: hypothetical protein Cgig2_006990 [Carnegiea gigantea]|uniref:Histidine decarboxylase n=1 Tax=Carnegiea gigantea TaxID=171969 RepID=A0A9Q1JE41_9CARY|nr:LOW QUALITY PROTEIN: hypothetical protein Cgig2_006990 [Carnegiea gigantea]
MMNTGDMLQVGGQKQIFKAFLWGKQAQLSPIFRYFPYFGHYIYCNEWRIQVLHELLCRREVFPDGILYASKESHYSVFKAARMYRMDCIKIETLMSGEIDCTDFKAKLLQNKDKPAIVNVNIGTTFKGAIDDLDLVIQTLAECGFSRNQFYIHCDGALFGIMLPFVEQAPQITFKKPIDSASVSGHKLLGCPMPCGVLITRIEHVNALSKDIEYIASRDVTITCSRSGHAPILLWYILSKKGRIGLQKDIQKCLQNAKYLRDRLRNAGVSVMLNELSNIVVFERPPDEEFIKRWQLSCQGNIGHIVVMVNVSKQKLDVFLDELTEKLSTWSKEGAHPCVAFDIGRGYCFCFFYRISFDNNNRGRDNGDNRGHVLYNNWRGWLWSRGGSYSNNNASTESQPSNRSVPA